MTADDRLAALSDDAWNRVLDVVLEPSNSLGGIRDSLSEDERELLHVALIRWISEQKTARALLIDGLDPLPDDYWTLSPLARKLALLGKRAQSTEAKVRILTLRRFLAVERSCAEASA